MYVLYTIVSVLSKLSREIYLLPDIIIIISCAHSTCVSYSFCSLVINRVIYQPIKGSSPRSNNRYF